MQQQQDGHEERSVGTTTTTTFFLAVDVRSGSKIRLVQCPVRRTLRQAVARRVGAQATFRNIRSSIHHQRDHFLSPLSLHLMRSKQRQQESHPNLTPSADASPFPLIIFFIFSPRLIALASDRTAYCSDLSCFAEPFV